MDKHDCVTCVHCSNVASVSIFFISQKKKFWITQKKQIVILIFFSEEDEGETDSDEEEMQTASTCKLVVNVHKSILI